MGTPYVFKLWLAGDKGMLFVKQLWSNKSSSVTVELYEVKHDCNNVEVNIARSINLGHYRI